jgi:hypothetical protein
MSIEARLARSIIQSRMTLVPSHGQALAGLPGEPVEPPELLAELSVLLAAITCV